MWIEAQNSVSTEAHAEPSVINRFVDIKQDFLSVVVILNVFYLEPLLVLIEYVQYGDLLGYLRKSRGLNDTYYEDPDIKPKTSLTSQQLMKFAWQIADGMNYLSLRKASLSYLKGFSFQMSGVFP